ncbi:MAG TPA: lipid-A-disaccharide synthase [Chitinophagaceae bacterium]|nr:lipid-A-disaccharide synthase [Chitinophagaceae bacterium]
MKYYIIAGEASGDLHGSNLVKELKRLDTRADIRCWGGDLMQAAGAVVVKHYKELAFMGFAEVIKNLPTIMRNLKFCRQDIQGYNPDVLVLIDYPGFNLRIAKWAKQQGYKVVYYISPQVWAWKESRVKGIRKIVDRMLVILPFEEEYFANRWNYKVIFVGHPLLEAVSSFLSQPPVQEFSPKEVIALLPGSRKQEIEKKLPLMLQVSTVFPKYQFIVAKASSLDDSFYQQFLNSFPHVQSIRNQTYELLSQATAALVTSGTATLETALFEVPQVVCYKGSAISYHIARRLVKIKYISLVNLIMDREVVKELIQDELTKDNIVVELRRILFDMSAKEQIMQDYQALKAMLQQEEPASTKAAEVIIEVASSTASPQVL